jgi:lipopolysaccharide transport system ATP-binding protein
MSSDELSIRVEGLSKRYEIYAQPADRLKQMILPRVQRAMHREARAYFHEFWALRDVSFDVSRGETVGIVGRNGSGKSTLLQLICDTLTPTLGTVSVRGRVAALLELGSGFNPEFTGRENVYLNAAVLGLSRVEIDNRFDAITAFADIGEFIEQPVKTYSSGMYVRLAFAVAINVDPEILVVDEALSVGDEAFQRKCFARINQIRESGATVLFVSHSGSTVTELCNRAVLLDGGELLTMGSPKFVISRYQKLLYSPSDKYATIRNAIRQHGEDDLGLDGSVDLTGEEPAGEAISHDGHVVEAESAINAASVSPLADESPERDEAYFEEGMVPASTFRYDSAGATIEDAHIETLEGRRVNFLQSGRDYVYAYQVHFSRDVTAVRCGMLIKSVTGLELAGSITSWSGERLVHVPTGTRLSISFRFPCLFASGAYFLNAGVQGCVDGEDVYLDRLIDAVMFKVIHEPGRLATTTMDIGIVPDVCVESSEVLPA